MKPTQFQVTKISKQTSRYTHKPVFAMFFKADDGRSYKTWLDPGNGNFKRWENMMKVGNVLTGINLKGNSTLIDADSFPRLVPQEVTQPETAERIASETIAKTSQQAGLL